MRSIIEFTRFSEFAVIALAYIVGYLLVDYIVAPIQYLYLSRDFTVGSLLFVPHGIRVLAVWLCGSRAILPLIIAELLCSVLLWQPDVAISTSLGSSMVGGICVYLTFELFRLAGIEMHPKGKTLHSPTGDHSFCWPALHQSLTLLENKSSLKALRH